MRQLGVSEEAFSSSDSHTKVRWAAQGLSLNLEEVSKYDQTKKMIEASKNVLEGAMEV